jgi:hypothetical protein
LAVLEPVWDFIARSVDSDPIEGKLIIDVSGSDGRIMEIESSRSGIVRVYVHNTDSGFLIVEERIQERQLPTQSDECLACIGVINPSFACSEKFISNYCGAIIDHDCAAEWSNVKHLCKTCVVPI